MINFFRKIRKQLVDTNKLLKYALYAIGEIVLVVIGILIALNVNNWNENNKNVEVRRNYYHQILQDFEKDRIFMEETILILDSTEVRMESHKKIYKQPDQTIWKITNNLSRVIKPGFFLNVKTNTNTITTLQNTGDIKLLPPLIRNKVLDFKNKQLGIMDHIQRGQENIVNNLLSISNLFGGNELGMRVRNQPKLIKYYNNENIQIQSLMGLESTIYETGQIFETAKKHFEELLLDIEDIKKLINEEMKK